MTSCNFGDIVLIGFPFTNLEATKKRPEVIVSRHCYQESRPDVILMAVTSRIRQPLAFGECLIEDWQEAGLLKPSVLKPLIATIEQLQVLKKMGTLSASDQMSLQKLLHLIIGETLS